MIEAHFGRQHLLMFDFHVFQECEAQNEDSRTNLCIRRGGAEVGMIAVHHLGALWAHHALGWETLNDGVG